MEQLLSVDVNTSHSQRILAIVDYLQQTIERHEPLSETSTYKLFDRIAERLAVSHPQILIVHNITHKLKSLIHERIEDTEDEPTARKKDRPNLKELFADLSLHTQPSISAEPQSQEQPRRVKIATLEELNNCKQDLSHLYMEISRYISSHIRVNSNIVIYEPSPEQIGVLAEVNNKIPHTLTIVTTDKTKYNPEKVLHPLVELKNSSSAIKKADMVIIPCSAVLKDGGIVAKSGSIMLAIAARSLSVPVVGLATCYSLTNRFCFQPNSFNCLQNPYNHFKQTCDKQYGQTLIVKQYDNIAPKYIDLVITDIGQATPSYTYKLFEKHYE